MRQKCSWFLLFVTGHTAQCNLGLWWAVEHGPATCPGSQEPPGLYKQRCSQQTERWDYPPLFLDCIYLLHQVLDHPVQERHGQTGSSVKVHEFGWGLEHLSMRRRWGSSICSAWRRDSFRVDLTSISPYLGESLSEDRLRHFTVVHGGSTGNS